MASAPTLPAVCISHKATGNAAAAAGNWTGAIQAYTAGIEAGRAEKASTQSLAVLYANRSAGHLAQGQFRRAAGDARVVTGAAPSYAKGWARLGAALAAELRATSLHPDDAQELLQEATQAYQRVLQLEPSNATARRDLDALPTAESLGVVRGPPAAGAAAAAAAAPPAEEEEDDLAALFKDVDAAEAAAEPAALPAPIADGDEPRKSYTWRPKAGEVEIARLTQPHYEWINLNAYEVLGLDLHNPTDDVDEIRHHFKRLSAAVHPDKNLDSGDAATIAFDYVRKAYDELCKKESREMARTMLMSVADDVAKQRKLAKKAGKELAPLAEHMHLEARKAFAGLHARQRNYQKKLRAAMDKAAKDEADAAAQAAAERKEEEAWKEQAEARIDNWQAFLDASGPTKRARTDVHEGAARFGVKGRGGSAGK